MTDARDASTQENPLINPDLAPVPPEKRTWNQWHIAALWVGMAVCITTYTLASGLIKQGMNWWQAVLCVLLGNLIVLIPMTLNAHPGTAYGIPFPVLLRASFGTYGSNVPALARGVVACGWFGIQTWVGGAAIYQTGAVIFGYHPAAREIIPVLGISSGELLCFLLFWVINVWFIWRGMESIKWMEAWSAPFLLVMGVALLIWAVVAAQGFGPIFSRPSRFSSDAEAWRVFGAGLTAMVGYWATLSLNIPDFSRFARSQRDQLAGQAMGLPATMAFFSFIGIVVTSATALVFHEEIWDPVVLVGKFGNPVLSAAALIALAVATLSTNIAANIVSPANDLANLAPRYISFRTGGLIAAVVGIAIQPWRLYADPTGYIFTWLLGYSALLGPIAGIMIADYFVFRRRKLNVAALYDARGEYGRVNAVGFLALALAVAPNVPGFLAEIGVIAKDSLPAFFLTSYRYAWFTGFGSGFLLYLLFRRFAPNSRS